MKVFGWLLTIVGGALAFYGAFIGNTVYGLYGKHSVMHMPSIMFGGLMLIVGVMMLLASGFSKKDEESVSSIKTNERFNGVAKLDNDAYKIYLTKRYDINFNNTLNKYICSDKLFDNVDDALLYARDLNWKEYGITDGIIKANENYDGKIICPICNAQNDSERKECRFCKYELITDADAKVAPKEEHTTDGITIAVRFLGVLAVIGLIYWLITY